MIGDCSDDLLCQTDLDQDGETRGSDHLILLNAWGDCLTCTESAVGGGDGAMMAATSTISDDPMIQMMLTLAEATDGDVPQAFLEEFWAYMDNVTE